MGALNSAKEADFQLDAAQRRKLPLWIREGLEKMEKEKQKKVFCSIKLFNIQYVLNFTVNFSICT